MFLKWIKARLFGAIAETPQQRGARITRALTPAKALVAKKFMGKYPIWGVGIGIRGLRVYSTGLTQAQKDAVAACARGVTGDGYDVEFVDGSGPVAN